MAKISRKDLKKDEITEDLVSSVGYLVAHRNLIIVVAVAAIAIGAGLAFYLGHRRTQTVEAQKAMQAAIELYHGQVNTEERMGMITFATTVERVRRTTEALEGVKKQYAGLAQSYTVEYYLALLDIEQEKYQEAQTKLEAAIQNGDSETAALARLTMAEVQERQGKDAEVRQLYQYLIDHPTTMVPKERAQLAFARYLKTREPEKAKEILTELMQKPGVLGGAASATMRELAGT